MRRMRARTMRRIQQMVGRELTETCTLTKQADAEGVYGEPILDWIEVGSGIKCRVIRAGSSMAGSNVIAGGRESLLDKHRLILPVGTVVGANYRAEMADGRVYEVVDVVDDLTDLPYVQVVVSRLRGSNG